MGAALTAEPKSKRKTTAELSSTTLGNNDSYFETVGPAIGAQVGWPAFLAAAVQRNVIGGSCGDPLEREAEDVTDQVMGAVLHHRRSAQEISAGLRIPGISPTKPTIRRKCACGASSSGECEECRNEREQLPTSVLHRHADRHNESRHGEVPAIVHEALAAPGQPLELATRAFFEPRFGRDLSDVRIHSGSKAAAATEAVHANAFALGNSIWFGAGKYTPNTHSGRELIAHELVHTSQQRSAAESRGPMPQRQNVALGRQNDPAESEADHIARSIMGSSPGEVSPLSADHSGAIRGAWYDDAWDAVSGAGSWVGGKLESAGGAVVDAAKWAGGKVVSAGKRVGKWAIGKAEHAWDCLMSMGHGVGNLLTGDVDSLTDLLGIPAPAGEDPSLVDTLIAVAKHPCLQMLPGYGLVVDAVDIIESVGKFLVGAWRLIQNPQPIIDGLREAIGKMIGAIPDFVGSVVDKALQSAGSKFKEHGLGVWRHLEPKLDYLAKNWWQVIKDTGWQLLWPWPSVSKEIGAMWDHMKAAADHIWNLEFSEGIDEVLAVGRSINSIAGSLYGWFFIASVLVGAILGGIFGVGAGAIPGALAGAAFAAEVGEALLAFTIGIESASLLKAAYNLVVQKETQEQKEKDYEQIASSGLTLGITGAMVILSEIAVKFAQGVLSRVAGLFRRAGATEVEEVAGTAGKTAGGEGIKAEVTTSDLPQLREQVHAPDGVHPPQDPSLSAKYDAEIEVGDHTYRRSNTDGTWCRFSEPICGIDIPEIKTEVDTALAPKPEELPPEIAAETPEPNSPEALTTDANVEPATPESPVKSAELKPGSPQHKAARWQEYQARTGGKGWKYERWSKVYDRNMVRAVRARAAEAAYHQKLGWGELSGNKPGPVVEGVERRFDISDIPSSKGVEVKTGKIYLTQEIAWEILRDKILVEQGWDIEWHFDTRPSNPLLAALQDAKIKVTIDTPATPVKALAVVVP